MVFAGYKSQYSSWRSEASRLTYPTIGYTISGLSGLIFHSFITPIIPLLRLGRQLSARYLWPDLSQSVPGDHQDTLYKPIAEPHSEMDLPSRQCTGGSNNDQTGALSWLHPQACELTS